MRKLRVLFLWLLLLTKRLYKKPAFLAILVIIPVVVYAYSLTTQHESGMLTIALSAQAPDDAFSRSLINELRESSDIIRFISANDPVSAEEMVCNGAADAAWIISSNAQKELNAFVSGHYTGKGFVRVVVREETVPLLLANEKLSGSLFARCAKISFVEHMRREDSLPDHLSDEEIAKYFEGANPGNDLFSYAYITDRNSKSNNYLLMPVRGMLSIIVLIGAMAAAMFYITDEEDGLFSWINLRNKPYVEYGCQIIAVSNIMLVTVISILAAEVSVGVGREIFTAIIYILCCAAFGRFIRIICLNKQTIGMLMPLLAMLMLVICPVFVSIPMLKHVQMLFPPTYYLQAIYNDAYLLYMTLYTAFLVALSKIFSCVKIFRQA